jgi:hypothetical protein
MTIRAARFSVVIAGFMLFSLRAAAAELTFQDRVAAQEAIERIYYAHQA